MTVPSRALLQMLSYAKSAVITEHKVARTGSSQWVIRD